VFFALSYGRRLAKSHLIKLLPAWMLGDHTTVKELERFGVAAECFQADVANESAVEKLVKDVVSRFDSLDVAVTTSSIWKTIELEDVTAADVIKSFEINTLGTFLVCKHAGLKMVSQAAGGSIVTISDSLIHHPYADHAAYFTAKGSNPTLTKCFAVELGNRNPRVRVNSIEP